MSNSTERDQVSDEEFGNYIFFTVIFVVLHYVIFNLFGWNLDFVENKFFKLVMIILVFIVVFIVSFVEVCFIAGILELISEEFFEDDHKKKVDTLKKNVTEKTSVSLTSEFKKIKIKTIYELVSQELEIMRQNGEWTQQIEDEVNAWAKQEMMKANQ